MDCTSQSFTAIDRASICFYSISSIDRQIISPAPAVRFNSDVRRLCRKILTEHHTRSCAHKPPEHGNNTVRTVSTYVRTYVLPGAALRAIHRRRPAGDAGVRPANATSARSPSRAATFDPSRDKAVWCHKGLDRATWDPHTLSWRARECRMIIHGRPSSISPSGRNHQLFPISITSINPIPSINYSRQQRQGHAASCCKAGARLKKARGEPRARSPGARAGGTRHRAARGLRKYPRARAGAAGAGTAR
jgi:hypothetical protein